MPAHRQRKTPNVRTFHVIAPHWLHHRIIISLNTMRVDLVDETFRMNRPPRANPIRRIPRLDTARARPLSSCLLFSVRARRASSRNYRASRHRVRRPRATTPSVIDDRIQKASTGSIVRALNCAANARRRRACERATRSSEPAWVDVFFSASVEGRRPTRARSRVDGRRRPRRRAGRPPSSGSDVFG